MSGLGIDYPPPTENLPIFDGLVFPFFDRTTPAPAIPSGQLIGRDLFTFTQFGTFQQNITPPAGTKTIKVVGCGRGGLQQPDSLNGSTMTAGVTGGGGGIFVVTMALADLPTSRIGSPVLYWANNSSDAVLGWVNSVYFLYAPSLPVAPNFPAQPFNWYAYTIAKGGSNNPEYMGGIAQLPPQGSTPQGVRMGTAMGNIVYYNGSDGVATTPFDYFTSTVTSQYGRNLYPDICADDGDVLAGWTRGGYSTYSNGVTTAYENGWGGVAIYYYT